MTDGKRRLGRSTELLPAEKRAKHYRAAATEAFGRAEATRDIALRAEYFDLAAGWHNLAFEVERQTGVPDDARNKTSQSKRPRT